MQKLLFSAAVVLLAACGDGKADAVKKMAEADSSAQATTMDLAGHGFPLVVDVPDPKDTDGATAVVVFNENSGKLEVRAGQRFAFTVVEDAADLERVKGDLERDLLKRNTVVRETPDELIYKSEFPDDPALTYLHFLKVVPAGGRTFIVEDLQDGVKLTEQDVERMVRAVRPASAS